MRWFWIDRFTSFESGRSASAVKNVTLSEEALDNYTPGRPNLPYALIIEGMAQTAG
jgi:3-hydroxyacyl-[acyl-carrier-protein] dehydratase